MHHTSLAGPRRTVAAVILATTLALAITSALHAQSFSEQVQIVDSLKHAPGMHLLHVSRIDPDCAPDSVYGTVSGDLGHQGYLPRFIIWGRSGGCHDATVSPTQRRAYTAITYPSLTALHGSTSFMSVNGDSLADLVFALRGTIIVDGKPHDSTRLVAVFGQYGLSALTTIDLAAVTGAFVTSPFIAMELRKGSQLVEPAIRDLSGSTSYELPSIAYTITPPDTTQHGSPGRAATVRVFPNPAATSANVEALSVPAGEYDVDVIATDGAVVLQQQVSLAVDGNLLQTLDVGRLPSGYYVVRLARGGHAVGAYPVVITR